MRLGGLYQLGTWSNWEVTAAQRAFLLGPDKHTAKNAKNGDGKPLVKLSMEQMREMTRKTQERKAKAE